MKVLLTLILLLWATAASAAVQQPEFDPQLGGQIRLDTPLTDSTNRTETLGQFTGGRPALILFGYHDCPNQCGIAQQVIATALKATGLGSAVAPLFITLAPEEGPTDAAGAKARLAAAAGDAATPWQFLSGPDVAKLGEQFGIGAIERAQIHQYVHPVAVYTLTPGGRISHVLPGLDLTATDLKLALIDASNNQLGTVIDHIMLWCSGYDMDTGKYTAPVIGLLRVAAIATLILGLGGLAFLELRKRRWTP
jgi:protein SCO1/2